MAVSLHCIPIKLVSIRKLGNCWPRQGIRLPRALWKEGECRFFTSRKKMGRCSLSDPPPGYLSQRNTLTGL